MWDKYVHSWSDLRTSVNSSPVSLPSDFLSWYFFTRSFLTMKVTLFPAAAAFYTLALAAPATNVPDPKIRFVQHERRDESSPWIKRDAIASTFTLPMRIGLTQGNLDKGHGLLMDMHVFACIVFQPRTTKLTRNIVQILAPKVMGATTLPKKFTTSSHHQRRV